MRTLLPLLLLYLALPARSQWHSSDPAHLIDRFQFIERLNPVDSSDFARFGEAIAQAVPDSGPVPDPHEYRLVWAVTCEGGTSLERGAGTDLKAFLRDPPEKRFQQRVCCPRFYGGRYAVVHWEPPTGLVRYRYWFFERVEK